MRRYDEGRVTHYVRPNEVCRVPRRHIALHSVATRRKVKGGQVNSWGVSAAVFWAAEKGRTPKPRTEIFDTAEGLWTAVGNFVRKGARTIVWCHNVGHDVRLTAALRILPRLGWSLTAHNLAPRGTWLIWDRDGARLTIVDISAVIPKLLGELGKLFGTGVVAESAGAETRMAQTARASWGADTIAAAVIAYLGWLDRDGLGNWQVTGAGQSFAAFRHNHMTHKLLVHDDEDALVMERRAMWTGRCEAYWHGTFRREVIHEWDYSRAYPSICAVANLPTKLVGPMPARYPWRRSLTDARVAVLAHVRVTTSVPCVPTLHDGHIVWPVGTFETVLWTPELAVAVEAGATIEVLSGYLYRTTPALAQWARWILAELDRPDSEVPAWQKAVLKHWSTALIGRFAMAFPEWEDLAIAPRNGVDRRTCVDADTGETYEVMQVGRAVFRQTGLTEWQHSQPAITGYVMSAMRAKLWRTMQALPDRTVLYVDTDSILVADGAHDVVAGLADTELAAGLRLKRSWDGFSIFGPRQIVTGNRVRVAGVPVSATRIDRTVFTGQIWESLAAAMGARHADKVVVKDRVWRAKCVDRRRVGTGFGWTHPITIGA